MVGKWVSICARGVAARGAPSRIPGRVTLRDPGRAKCPVSVLDTGRAMTLCPGVLLSGLMKLLLPSLLKIARNTISPFLEGSR